MKHPTFHWRYRMMLSVIFFAVLLCSQGCSFLSVNGPPNDVVRMQQEQQPVRSYFQCTESNIAPVLDTVWASLNALGAAQAMASSENEIEDRSQVIVVGVTWAVVSGIAAITGYSKTSKCRSAKRWQMESL